MLLHILNVEKSDSMEQLNVHQYIVVKNKNTQLCNIK